MSKSGRSGGDIRRRLSLPVKVYSSKSLRKVKLTWPKVLFALAPGQTSHRPTAHQEAVSAILLSNACHLASAISLYKLTLLCGGKLSRSKSVAWLAATLHIISPGGLFLSAPYSDSLFSFLAVFGTYLYALSLKMIGSERHMAGNMLTLLSAMIFSAASTVRSNGILNGVLFLFDFLTTVLSILKGEQGIVQHAIRIVVLGVDF